MHTVSLSFEMCNTWRCDRDSIKGCDISRWFSIIGLKFVLYSSITGSFSPSMHVSLRASNESGLNMVRTNPKENKMVLFLLAQQLPYFNFTGRMTRASTVPHDIEIIIIVKYISLARHTCYFCYMERAVSCSPREVCRLWSFQQRRTIEYWQTCQSYFWSRRMSRF